MIHDFFLSCLPDMPSSYFEEKYTEINKQQKFLFKKITHLTLNTNIVSDKFRFQLRKKAQLPCYGLCIIEQKLSRLLNPITLFGTGGDIFIPLSFLDQILSAELCSNISKLFWRWKFTSIGLFWHHAQLIESYKSCPLGALNMSICLAFTRHARQG